MGSYICCNLDEPWKHDAKLKKPDTKVYTLFDSISENPE